MLNESEIEHENTFSLTYNPNVPCIEMLFHGYSTSAEFKEHTEAMLTAIQTYYVNKILVDTLDMKIIAIEDQKWLTECWLPKAIKAGYRACAILNSKHFFNRIAVQNIANSIDPKLFNLQLFDNKIEARAWLKNLNIKETHQGMQGYKLNNANG